MKSKRLKFFVVIVSGKNDIYKVSAVSHVSSPLCVNIAKAVLLERFSRSFPEMTFHVNVVRVYE